LGSSLKTIVMKLTRKKLKMTKKTLFAFRGNDNGGTFTTVVTGDPISITATTVVFTTH
jgi:hypothetical protein